MKEGASVFCCLLALNARAMACRCLRASLSGSRLARAINSFRRLGQGVGKVEGCPVLDLENADFKGYLNLKTGHSALIIEIYAQSLGIDVATDKGI